MAITTEFKQLESRAASVQTDHLVRHESLLTNSRQARVLLWIVQGLLAIVFLFAGVAKLVLPTEVMTAQMQPALPGLFLRFLGLAEVLGALGMILPGLTRIRQGLTPLAASGFVPIMIGATVYTLIGDGGATALIPLVVGVLAAFVAIGRWRVAPRVSSS